MTRTYRQCYRHRSMLRPVRDLMDVGRLLAAYYARYYGPCRDARKRTLDRKARALMDLFEVPA